MIAATACCCVVPLLLFLKTLIDIALLRKGPGHVPRSGLLLSLAVLLWLTAVLLALALIDRFDEADVVREIFSVLIAVVCYSAIVIAARQSSRLTQTITAILGCGALLTMVFVASYVVLQAFAGVGFMTLVAWMILLWSLSVKGHIIASAINRHWYVGLAMAVTIFILQSVANKFVTTAA